MKTKLLTTSPMKRGLLCFALGTFTGLVTNPAIAQQWVATYDFSDPVKGYSTEIATGAIGAPEASVMAGTIYNYNGNQKKIHYLFPGLNGGINASVEIDDPNYEEERPVDIASNGVAAGATFYITCQARPAAGNGNDRILIVAVDVWGNLVDDAIAIHPMASNEGMYPLHSIYHPNGHLYICGFITDNNTGLPAEPGYLGYDHKKSFVLKYDPVTKTVVNNIVINTTYLNQNAAKDDFDMAMRLVKKSNDDIFVTGGVNNVKLNSLSASELYHSGTMNIVLDQNLNLVNESHFANGYEVTYAGDEFGIGMVEDPGDPNKNYIIGNYFYRNTGVASSFGLDAFGGFLNATWVDQNFNHTNSGTSRYRFAGYDYAWALQTLPSNTAPGNGGVTLLIPGMQTNEWCGTYSNDDIRPFLFDVELNCNTSLGNITGYFNQWTTYRTQTGTGALGAGADNYAQMGEGLANVMWNPTFAARNSSVDHVVMSAPRQHFPSLPWSGNRLRLKRIKAEFDDLETPDCTPNYNTEFAGSGCVGTFDYQQVYDIGYPANPVTTSYGMLNYSMATTPMANLLTGAYGYSQDFCYVGNTVHKPTGLGHMKARSTATYFYPNPAHKEAMLSLGKDVKEDANLRVVLMNIYGQMVSELYAGTALSLIEHNVMQLPDVAAGLYIIAVSADGMTLHQQKLYIQ